MQTGAPTDGTPADQKIMIDLVLRSSKAHVFRVKRISLGKWQFTGLGLSHLMD